MPRESFPAISRLEQSAEHALPPAEAHGDRSMVVRNIALYSGQTPAPALDGGAVNGFMPMPFAPDEQSAFGHANPGRIPSAVLRAGGDFVVRYLQRRWRFEHRQRLPACSPCDILR